MSNIENNRNVQPLRTSEGPAFAIPADEIAINGAHDAVRKFIEGFDPSDGVAAAQAITSAALKAFPDSKDRLTAAIAVASEAGAVIDTLTRSSDPNETSVIPELSVERTVVEHPGYINAGAIDGLGALVSEATLKANSKTV